MNVWQDAVQNIMHISRAFSHYENPIKVINYYKSSGLLQSTQYVRCSTSMWGKEAWYTDTHDTLIHMYTDTTNNIQIIM